MIRYALFCVLILAFLLRILGIANFPAGFSPDEAGQGYTAYSLLKTGRDEWGEKLPIMPRSFGDYRAPLYTYLTVPSVAIFGLNEFATRLPSAISGTLAVLVVYLLVLQLFPKASHHSQITSHKSPALMSAFLLAISPWHISLSRGAYEPNLPTLLVPLGVLLFLKSQDEKYAPKKQIFILCISVAVFSLGLFSYYSARFVIPLLLALLAFWYIGLNNLKSFVTKFKIPVILFGIIFILVLVTSFFGGNTRAGDVAIFSPTGGWGAVSDRRYEAITLGLPEAIARLYANKLTYVINLFAGNFLSYLSPQFLFTNGAGEATYGMTSGIGVLYLVELPFLVIALYFLLAKKEFRDVRFVIIWLLLSIIPAALSKGPGYAANRVALMMPQIQIISALGLMLIYKYLATKFNKKFVFAGFALLLSFSVLNFLEHYFYHAPVYNAKSMSYGWRETINFVNGIEENYDQILVSKRLSEPQIFVAFYKKIDPRVVQKESKDWLRYQSEGKLFVDQLGEYKLGKYTFRHINYTDDAKLGSVLLIGVPADFPENAQTMKTINYPGGKSAILIVDPNKTTYVSL